MPLLTIKNVARKMRATIVISASNAGRSVFGRRRFNKYHTNIRSKCQQYSQNKTVENEIVNQVVRNMTSQVKDGGADPKLAGSAEISPEVDYCGSKITKHRGFLPSLLSVDLMVVNLSQFAFILPQLYRRAMRLKAESFRTVKPVTQRRQVSACDSTLIPVGKNMPIFAKYQENMPCYC